MHFGQVSGKTSQRKMPHFENIDQRSNGGVVYGYKQSHTMRQEQTSYQCLPRSSPLAPKSKALVFSIALRGVEPILKWMTSTNIFKKAFKSCTVLTHWP